MAAAQTPQGALEEELRASRASLEADLRAQAQAQIELTRSEAQAYMAEELRKLGLPPLPLSLPSSLTPESLAKAATDGGMSYLEALARSELGVPIQLPRRLTLEDLGASIGSVIPTDLASVVDTGLFVASQGVAGALSGLLAGAGIGSVVPGLGTLVGIATAIGFSVVKGLIVDLFEPETPAYRRVCEDRDVCVLPPQDGDVWQLLGWAATWYTASSKKYAEIQQREYCTGGGVHACLKSYGTIATAAAAALRYEPEKLTAPETAEILAVFKNVPLASYKLDTGSNTVVLEWGRGFYPKITDLLDRVRARQAYLAQLAERFGALYTLNAVAVRALQEDLLKEVRSTPSAVQQSQGRPLFAANVGQLMLAVAAFKVTSRRYMELAGIVLVPPKPPPLLPSPPVTAVTAFSDWAFKNPDAAETLRPKDVAYFVATAQRLERGELTLPAFGSKVEMLVADRGRAYRRRTRWPVAFIDALMHPARTWRS